MLEDILHAITTTPTPNPSPQGIEFKSGSEESLSDFNKLFGLSREPPSPDCI